MKRRFCYDDGKHHDINDCGVSQEEVEEESVSWCHVFSGCDFKGMTSSIVPPSHQDAWVSLNFQTDLNFMNKQHLTSGQNTLYEA